MRLIKNVKSTQHVKLLHPIFKISNPHKSTLLANNAKHSENRNSKMNEIDSYDAVQKIKTLQKYNQQNMVIKAFEIYNNLQPSQKKEVVMNAVLDCCKKIPKKQMCFN
eukprot:331684_1